MPAIRSGVRVNDRGGVRIGPEPAKIGTGVASNSRFSGIHRDSAAERGHSTPLRFGVRAFDPTPSVGGGPSKLGPYGAAAVILPVRGARSTRPVPRA